MNIAYIRPLFPKLSETFLLEEILRLTELGHRVRVYAVRAELDALHKKIIESNILDEVEYVPLKLSLYPKARHLAIFAYHFFRSRKFRRHYFASVPGTVEADDALPAATGAARLRRTSPLHLSVQIGNRALARRQARVVAREFVPDVIHCPSLFRLGNRILRILQARFPGVPYTVALRARDLYERSGAGAASGQGPWKEQAVKAAARIITISRENQAVIEQTYPGRPDIPIVHSGIDVDYFCPDGVRRPEPDLVVAVARLIAKKGLHHLIDACAVLRDRGVPVRCVIVGDGPQQSRFKAQIEALNLGRQVTLHGAGTHEQVRTLLARAAVFVLPCVIAEGGDRDILPNSVKEAMAMKVPVITSRISGIEELIDHGESGILVSPAQPVELADWIARLRTDVALSERLGEKGRARICADFDARREAEKLAAVLADVVRPRSGIGAVPGCVRLSALAP